MSSPRNAIDEFVAADIAQDIHRIETIYATDIFGVSNAGHPLVKSAFIEVMVCLRDLMAKTKLYGTQIIFTDDMVVTSKIQNISKLIIFVRDALCHIESPNNFAIPDQIKSSFNIVYGKGTDNRAKGINLVSEYTDDTCFFFGLHKIYLKRHILRAFEETRRQLEPLLKPYDAVRDSWKM